jgi:IS30 family transposase
MRGRLSRSEVTRLWEQWREGSSAAAIARSLERSYDTVCKSIRARGGVAPLPRRRRELSLSAAEREEISLRLANRESYRAIGRALGRNASTICREANRNGGRHDYRAVAAEDRALAKALRPKTCKLRANTRLRDIVAAKLALEWSPEQISGWLKTHHPRRATMQISPETIYRSLFIQTRGALKKELVAQLRLHRPMRRAKTVKQRVDPRGLFGEHVSIRERPATVEDRAVPGHWEGDLLTGSLGNYIATLVERKSRYVMLVKVDSNQTADVISALKKQIRELPTELRKSLTWDRGYEMKRHKELSMATDMQVYICDPQSPWQRGTNENTNGLLRQYFPKGKSVSRFTQIELDAVARRLNERPRKTLGFKTPAEVLEHTLR